MGAPALQEVPWYREYVRKHVRPEPRENTTPTAAGLFVFVCGIFAGLALAATWMR